MQQDKVDMFIMQNQKYLPSEKIVFVRDKLQNADDSKLAIASSVKFKDPIVILIVSIFFGELGIDRFMIGNIGMGILKLLTFGLFGILWLIDLFIVQKKAKEINYNNLMMVL